MQNRCNQAHMNDEIPPESILPKEVLATIRDIFAQAAIGPQARLEASGQVIHLRGIASAESFGSVMVRLGYPDVSKKLWASPEGLCAIQLIAMVLLVLYHEHQSDVRGHQSEVFMKALVKEVEGFLLAHKEQPQPTPKIEHREKCGNPPTISSEGD
jgi:hypothetical protein